MLKSELLAALRTEIHRHDFSHFVDELPSVAQGGKGVVVAGCPACRKQFGTVAQLLDRPVLRLSATSPVGANFTQTSSRTTAELSVSISHRSLSSDASNVDLFRQLSNLCPALFRRFHNRCPAGSR